MTTRVLTIAFAGIMCLTSRIFCDEIVLEIKNPLSLARIHAPVSLSRTDLGIDDVETVTSLLIDRDGHNFTRPFQLDDLNSDGQWDELYFQVTIGAQETVKAIVVTGTEPLSPGTFGKQVHALIDAQPRDTWVVYKPVWESELMCYATYGAAQIDVIGKTYPQLVTGYYFGSEPQSPHEFNPFYGLDFLVLGNTMALHAFFVQEADGSIQRPWTTNAFAITKKITNDSRFDSQIISDGPLRAIVRQWIAGWVTDLGRYACEITYSISAMQRHTDVTVKLTEFPGRKKDLRIGAGMRRMYEDIHYEKTDGYMTAVAEDVHESGLLISRIGRAIITTTRYKTEELKIPNNPGLTDMPENGPNYGLLFPKGSATLKYAFVGAWDLDGGVESVEQWTTYLKGLSQVLEKPLTVRVKK